MMKNLKDKSMFVGIGAQKTGTTWLADYLSNHNQVCFSPLKELHYFNAKYLDRSYEKLFVKKLRKYVSQIHSSDNKFAINNAQLVLKRLGIYNDQTYMQYFDDLVKNEKIFGEITPAYSMLNSSGFRAIKNIHSDVKFIFMMRYPLDRYWSQVKYTVQFDKSFQPIENFDKLLNDKRYMLRTDYKRTIKALSSVVDNRNILYIFYENLFSKDKGEETVKKITDFLEIDYIKPDFGKSINTTKPIELDEHLKQLAIDKFSYIVEFVDQFFDGDIPKKWKN